MSTETQIIYLVRHAETTAQPEQIIGHTDVGLSSAGKKNVAKLIKSWKLEPPEKLYCSDLLRAKQTAEIINKNWQLEIEEHKQLRELNFGLWENKLWDEAYNSDTEFFNHWAENWHIEPTPMGECFEDIISRCHDWISCIMTTDSPTVIVAHAGSLRAITSILLDLPATTIFNFEFSYAGVTKIQITDGSTKLFYLNNFNFG